MGVQDYFTTCEFVCLEWDAARIIVHVFCCNAQSWHAERCEYQPSCAETLEHGQHTAVHGRQRRARVCGCVCLQGYEAQEVPLGVN